MHTDTVKGVTGAVRESERGVCLALLVQGTLSIEMPHRNLLVMEMTYFHVTERCVLVMGKSSLREVFKHHKAGT